MYLQDIMVLLTTILECVNQFAVTYKGTHEVEEEQKEIAAANGTVLPTVEREIFSPIFRGSKLFQQYIFDAYLRVESNNLSFVRQNKAQLRVDSYTGLMNHINSQPAQEGKIPGMVLFFLLLSQDHPMQCSSIIKMLWHCG